MVGTKIAQLPHGGDRTSQQGANLPLAPTIDEAAELPHGRPTADGKQTNLSVSSTIDEAAELLNVSERR